MKTHLNLATTDLSRSVAFYTTLLEKEPVKLLDDYALFITENPGLELALDLSESVAAGSDMHFGILVDDTEEIDRAMWRLKAAGLRTIFEREEMCCYANQTKVWASDPDGRRWEIYTVHEDTVNRNGGESCAAECCS